MRSDLAFTPGGPHIKKPARSRFHRILNRNRGRTTDPPRLCARSTRSIGLCDGRWSGHGLHSKKVVAEFVDLGVEEGQFVFGLFIA